ncbi:hypothetical protein K3175_03740 [Qipengyuania sp. GH1]|uniref:hypothetical protein n=1 Tax=Qipengyuania aestuarii TaxID=2867241 RepID=UPI001C88BF36|nr:hypothetical protein [Qipengyuania aestuarii]MBX7534763.1 hypothetical protein [Qipengyuania aestuarii]
MLDLTFPISCSDEQIESLYVLFVESHPVMARKWADNFIRNLNKPTKEISLEYDPFAEELRRTIDKFLEENSDISDSDGRSTAMMDMAGFLWNKIRAEHEQSSGSEKQRRIVE